MMISRASISGLGSTSMGFTSYILNTNAITASCKYIISSVLIVVILWSTCGHYKNRPSNETRYIVTKLATYMKYCWTLF